jgi:tetratricopeptide (TPR) repeat protein
LHSVKALKHFQDAFKLNPALVEALEEARFIYWDLGKLNMVQKLLELELKSAQDAPRTTLLLTELGDVLTDQGDYDRAAQTYARAVAAAGGASEEPAGCLADAQVEAATWQERMAELVRGAQDAPSRAAKARLFVRAARIAKRFAPDAVEDVLAQAYAADPASREAAALLESMWVEAQKSESIVALQRKVLAGAEERRTRAEMAFRFGARWATRHQNPDLGAEMLAEAFLADPSNEAAFAYLREVWGGKDGNWEKLVDLVDKAVAGPGSNGAESFLLAQAANVAWRQLGNLMRARAYFEKLSAVSPDHPICFSNARKLG